LGYTRLKGEKGAGGRQLGAHIKAPVNHFFKLTGRRSYTERRRNHRLACGDWGAAG